MLCGEIKDNVELVKYCYYYWSLGCDLSTYVIKDDKGTYEFLPQNILFKKHIRYVSIREFLIYGAKAFDYNR